MKHVLPPDTNLLPLSPARPTPAQDFHTNPTDYRDNGKLKPRTLPFRLPASLQSALKNKWLKFLLRLLGTVILFSLLFRSFSWSTVLGKLHNLDGGQLLIAAIVGLSGVMISSYQWQSLLDAERIHIDLRKLVNLYMVGIAFNHFLPTGMGGDVVKAVYVSKESNNSSGSASAVVISRLAGFAGMLLVSVPTILVWHSIFTRELTISFLLSCLGMCAGLGGALFLVTMLPNFVGRWASNKFFATLFKVGMTMRTSIGRPRAMCVAVLFGMLFHVSAALNYYAYAQVLHIHVPVTFYLVAIPFTSLIAFLPISINGYGLRETAFTLIFSTMHVAPALSFSLALLLDIQGLVFGAIGGCLYLSMGERKVPALAVRPTLQPQELPV